VGIARARGPVAVCALYWFDPRALLPSPWAFAPPSWASALSLSEGLADRAVLCLGPLTTSGLPSVASSEQFLFFGGGSSAIEDRNAELLGNTTGLISDFAGQNQPEKSGELSKGSFTVIFEGLGKGFEVFRCIGGLDLSVWLEKTRAVQKPAYLISSAFIQ
jgi:hypothetical protein